MKSQLRDLVASALYPTKTYNLPAVCERYFPEDLPAYEGKYSAISDRTNREYDFSVGTAAP